MTLLAVTDLAFAVVLGGAFGLGACLLISLTPRWGAPSLARRIAPYIRDVTDPRGVTPMLAGRGVDLAQLWSALQDRAAVALGGSASVDRRLHQAAWVM